MGKASRRKRKRSVTVEAVTDEAVTVEAMTGRMKGEVNDFKERHSHRLMKDGTPIPWALVLFPEEWETNDAGQVLANILNYDPMERHVCHKLFVNEDIFVEN